MTRPAMHFSTCLRHIRRK